jgi:hypothetical protein
MTGLEAVEQQAVDERRERRIAAVIAQGSEAQADHEERELERTVSIVELWLQS